jgi:putative DNA primase/helicase
VNAWTFDALPPNLPTGRRYVGWHLETRGKVPCVPTCCARRASVTDPATWDTFDTARDAYFDGKCTGIGLMLTGDVIALDLDHCLELSTHPLTLEATALLAAVPSYTEVSPSNSGIHVLLRGALPPGRRRRTGFECYDRDRFVTLTGWHVVGTPTAIVDHHDTLTALYPQWFPTSPRPAPALATVPLTDTDAALLEKAHHCRNGATFAALWSGDTTGYPSHSEADAALCRQLAFWTQRDPIRIDHLFRQSGLYRSKWDNTRGLDTYGARTIAHAIATTPHVYRPPLNLLELLEVPMPHAAD